jgi:hypothetical protein
MNTRQPCPGCRALLLPCAVKCRFCGRSLASTEPAKVHEETVKTGRQPNKTEEAYRRERLAYQDRDGEAAIIYEALTFRLRNGMKYTPDWVVLWWNSIVSCHEVKGSYRFPSHGRSDMAWRQAALDFPGIRWVRAVRRRGGGWAVEYANGKEA